MKARCCPWLVHGASTRSRPTGLWCQVNPQLFSRRQLFHAKSGRKSNRNARVPHKKSDRPHYDLFYFAKTTNQPPSQPPYSAVGKASGFKSQGRGLDPGCAETTWFFGFFFLFPKRKHVRAFSQPESTNQPVAIFGIMRQKKEKISTRVADTFYPKIPK